MNFPPGAISGHFAERFFTPTERTPSIIRAFERREPMADRRQIASGDHMSESHERPDPGVD